MYTRAGRDRVEAKSRIVERLGVCGKGKKKEKNETTECLAAAVFEGTGEDVGGQGLASTPVHSMKYKRSNNQQTNKIKREKMKKKKKKRRKKNKPCEKRSSFWLCEVACTRVPVYH